MTTKQELDCFFQTGMLNSKKGFAWTPALVLEWTEYFYNSTTNTGKRYTAIDSIMDEFKKSKEVKLDYEILTRSGCSDGINTVHTILSIKRLCDGEVFKVGDSINGGHKIKEFKVTGTSVKAYYNSREPTCCWLFSWVKDKPVLFTTSDGVEIKEGDSYWFVDNHFIISGIDCAGDEAGQRSDSKYFFTLKLAQDYLIENKPCLNFEDVMDVGSFDYKSEYIDALKTVIKSKLNIKDL